MPDDFAYINARLRGMHGRLVTARLEEALGANSYGEFLRVLSETDLAPDLADATAAGATLADLDAAVSRNFRATMRRILSFADGEPGREIAVLLNRYDLHNLKAIVRGKVNGRPAEEIEASLIPAGSLNPALLTQMARATDLNQVAQLLGLSGHPLRKQFRRGVAALSADNDLLAFEVGLDRAYYDEALHDAESDTLRNFMRREIDAANILTAAKLRAQGAPAADSERYFVHGGRELTRARFLDAVSGSGNLDNLKAFPGAGEATDLASVEGAVRAAMLADARRLYAADGLGIGVMIGYLKEKENEVALTRLIARGKFYGVPAETLRREVTRGA